MNTCTGNKFHSSPLSEFRDNLTWISVRLCTHGTCGIEHCWIRISSFVVAYRPVSRIRRYDAMRSVYLYQTFAEIVVSLEMDHRYRYLAAARDAGAPKGRRIPPHHCISDAETKGRFCSSWNQYYYPGRLIRRSSRWRARGRSHRRRDISLYKFISVSRTERPMTNGPSNPNSISKGTSRASPPIYFALDWPPFPLTQTPR